MFWYKRQSPCARNRPCLLDFPAGILRQFLFPLLKARDVAKLDTALLNRSVRTLVHEALVGADLFTPVGVKQFVWFARRKCSTNHLQITHGCSVSNDAELLRYLHTTQKVTVGRGSISLDELSTLLSYCTMLTSIVLNEITWYRHRWNVPATLRLISIEIGQYVVISYDCLVSLLSQRLRILKLGRQQPVIKILRKAASVCTELRELTAYYQSARNEPPTDTQYDEALRQILCNCVMLTSLSASVCTTDGYFGIGGSNLLHVRLHGQEGSVEGTQDTAVVRLVQASPLIQTLELHAFYENTDVTLYAIAEHLPDLQSLVLNNMPFATDEGLTVIRISCPKLTSIRLRMCDAIENTGLVAGPRGILEHLRLSTLTLTDSMLIECARHNCNLRTFQVERGGNFTGALLPTTLIEVVQYLPYLIEFVYDDLCGNRRLGDDFMCSVVQCCPYVQVFRIPNCHTITSAGQQQVSKLRHLRKLSFLGCGALTCGALCAIAKGCPALESLTITSASNKGIRHLAKYLRRLQYLTIRDCKWVRDHAVLKLLARAPNLRTFYIHNSYLLSYRLKQRLMSMRRSHW